MTTFALNFKAKINDIFLIYFLAAFFSILLSIWVAWRETVINPDAICYVQSAALIGAGGLRKAMNLCGQARWPLYSVLIYFTSHFTHLSLTVTAYALDTLFTAISVITFINIVRQLGGSKRILWLAAIVILLAHEFNSIRQYIIRDHGFLTFYLVSMSMLLKYFSSLSSLQQSPLAPSSGRYALFWGLSLLIATLFRIEGAVFLIILPFLVWFYSSLTFWQRIKGFIQLNAISLAAGLAVFGWLIFHPEISLASLGRMQDLIFQLFHAGGIIWQRLQESINAFGHTVLTSDSMQDATLVFSLTLIVWYLVRVATNLSLIYAGLVLYGFFRKALLLNRSSQFVLYGYLITNVIITSFFLAEHLFLSKRYLIALTLLLMLWVPFALDKLISERQTQKISRWVVPFVFLLVILFSLGGIFDFGYSKAYMRQAGDWLAENVPATASIYSNDYQIMYYSKHFGNDIFNKIREYSEANIFEHDQWKKYDYIVLRINKKELSAKDSIMNELKLTAVQRFSNKRGDEVVIYKRGVFL